MHSLFVLSFPVLSSSVFFVSSYVHFYRPSHSLAWRARQGTHLIIRRWFCFYGACICNGSLRSPLSRLLYFRGVLCGYTFVFFYPFTHCNVNSSSWIFISCFFFLVSKLANWAIFLLVCCSNWEGSSYIIYHGY